MEHKGTVTIETERLILRAFTPGDAPAMRRNWVTDAEVTRYLTWPPHDSFGTTRALAERWARDAAEQQDYYQWAIVPKELDEPFGSLSVVPMAGNTGEAELGYCIGRAWWGRGYVPEAVRAVIRYLIRDVGFHRVSARHDTRNPNSGRVMQKAGMRYEGTLRAAGMCNAGRGDLAVYAVLAEELKEP